VRPALVDTDELRRIEAGRFLPPPARAASSRALAITDFL
jgi:hypothetical protein